MTKRIINLLFFIVLNIFVASLSGIIPLFSRPANAETELVVLSVSYDSYYGLVVATNDESRDFKIDENFIALFDGDEKIGLSVGKCTFLDVGKVCIPPDSPFPASDNVNLKVIFGKGFAVSESGARLAEEEIWGYELFDDEYSAIRFRKISPADDKPDESEESDSAESVAESESSPENESESFSDTESALESESSTESESESFSDSEIDSEESGSAEERESESVSESENKSEDDESESLPESISESYSESTSEGESENDGANIPTSESENDSESETNDESKPDEESETKEESETNGESDVPTPENREHGCKSNIYSGLTTGYPLAVFIGSAFIFFKNKK